MLHCKNKTEFINDPAFVFLPLPPPLSLSLPLYHSCINFTFSINRLLDCLCFFFYICHDVSVSMCVIRIHVVLYCDHSRIMNQINSEMKWRLNSIRYLALLIDALSISIFICLYLSLWSFSYLCIESMLRFDCVFHKWEKPSWHPVVVTSYETCTICCNILYTVRVEGFFPFWYKFIQ